MLENEPNSGAEGTAGRTTETTEPNTTETPEVQAVGNGTAGRRRTASRRAVATRPAGPPPEPEPAPAAAPTGPITVAAADVPVESVPTDAEPPAEDKTAVRVTTVKKGRTRTRPAGPPPEPEPAPPVTPPAAQEPQQPSSEEPEETVTAEEPRTGARGTRAKTTRSTRTRSKRAKAAEPAQADTEEKAAEETAAQPEKSSTDSPVVAAPAGTVAVTFQPPMVVFQPPVAQQPATPLPDADVDAEEEELEETEEVSAREDSDDERPSRRRRRRGGRGRGRSRSADEGDEEQAEAGADEDDQSDEGAGHPEDEESAEETAQEENGGSSRRRRRRRRRSGADVDDSGPAPDDPPNTVVRVREPRAASPIEDEVQAVRGSTRLEAKKQRRREGREQGRRRAPIITESEFLARRESVKRDLVVRRIGERTQIAVLEDDVLVEHYVDRVTHKSYVGNVYLGRVQNVLPSMEAAFVDIGKGRNAVLYAGEVNWDASGLEGQPKRIESALKSGQSVLVQVTKDPLGHKGARLTSQISLPGRYLVYVPDGTMTGISRKLPDKERARLKQILKKVMPENAGVIVRTAAEGASEEELERDIARLAGQWESIKRKSKSATAPALLYSEPDLTVRVVRDVFNEDFSSLVVSGDEAWETVREYVDYVAPHLADRLAHWTDERDVFEAYRVDEQIAKALERKVWLPSGGSLVIDRTEAMTVVDVNTGKFTGQGGNLEETVTKNNLEAAEEIVRQLRLRDIGGIIVIDFIDMVLESNRDLVLRRMLECLSRDRTKHQVAEVTSLGLVQMTRKRVGQGLLEAFSQTCECCNGRGLILSTEPVESKGGGNGNGGSGRKKKGKGGAEKADKAVTEGEAPASQDEEQPSGEQPEAASAEPEKEKEKKAPRKTSRKSKKDTAAEPQATEPAADEGTAEAVSEPEEAPPAAEADGAETGSERPRRRRTRRGKSASTPETAVVEAG
ncbi:ribonuclease E [Marinactinospora thermotolerans DSM 45154]|uniref:Ribonuclease E n=1 Tax=Marinactinospora thermotolerans DSM 45154 TaxID=1122192 RepID=A0A1T4SNQ5_9ACTN|nr:Rne/Rng family ribonuclease [Marinactinospora thermotolerans]SKA29934.1 ribonuclease E [Marinactinospora thermotolerans DSM 45154]